MARPPGYLLDLPAEATDVALADRSHPAERSRRPIPAQSVAQLRAALGLWRGRALADVAGVPWLHEQGARLDDMRLDAVQALIDARMAIGEHAQLVPELERLAEQHPFREHIHQQLMLALYRSGRQADALARVPAAAPDDRGANWASTRARRSATSKSRSCGRTTRSTLRRTRRRIAASVAPAAATWAVPAQLPLAVPTFTGRAAELARLDTVLSGATGQPGPCRAVTISIVSGTAGVGKTALAIHWAHQVASQFPDGQLYVNLRGFDPGGTVMDPAEAIRGFLDAFAVPADRIPTTPDSQASLYRSVLARQAGADRHRQRPRRRARPAAAARRARLPGRGDQPQPAQRPDRDRGRATDQPGTADRRRARETC